MDMAGQIRKNTGHFREIAGQMRESTRQLREAMGLLNAKAVELDN